MIVLATEWSDWIPTGVTVIATISAIVVARAIIRRSWKSDHAVGTFRAQLAAIAITIVGLMVAILTLPETIDSQLAFSVVGLVFTGILAISSQSIIANAMAGLMLRSVASFRAGDFIEVAGHMGRVSELGLFHTEIQTPDRDLVTLPNSLMVNQPVRVVRSSGTIVSMTVSIGYDVSRHRLEPLFVEAARQSGLVDPFVQILELGDYSVQYRIAGFLEDPRSLIASRSQLRGAVLDTLSEDGVEIVSPTFIIRREGAAEPVIPHETRAAPEPPVPASGPAIEDRIFDKAEAAGQLEAARRELSDAIESVEALDKERDESSGARRSQVEAQIDQEKRRIDEITGRIESLTEAHEED